MVVYRNPATRGGTTPDGRKVKSTIQWVSSDHAVDVEVRLYESLFRDQSEEDDGKDLLDTLSPNSLEVKSGKIEPAVKAAKPGAHYQFERVGYFCKDKDSTEGKPVFNRTVALRDTWAKIEKSQQPPKK